MEFDIARYFPDATQEEGDAGRASFSEMRPLYLAGSKHFLNHYREQIKQEHRAGASGEWVVKAITAMSDTLITKLFSCIMDDPSDLQQAGEQLTLVAIGGYGRGELNPNSDIDLMFLHSGKAAQRIEVIAQKLLYFLWDMRLDVGYSVRTPADCLEMANSDITVKTALVDSRFLTGDSQLYATFQKMLLTQIIAKGSDTFIRREARRAEEEAREIRLLGVPPRTEPQGGRGGLAGSSYRHLGGEDQVQDHRAPRDDHQGDPVRGRACCI